MSRVVSMRYRGAEGLACPRCHEEGRGYVQLRNLGFKWRDDHRAPGGASCEPIVVRTRTGERLYPDDVREDDVERGGGGTAYSTTRWVHHFTLTCPNHPTAYHRRDALVHVFADDELPADYWAREVPHERD